MLAPNRVRYRKTQRGRMKGKDYHNCLVMFGDYGLMSLEPKWITGQQIESARIAINRVVKKFGKSWIRIFPDKPITKKPAETRQGSGKGNPEGYVAQVKPGTIMFEVRGLDEAMCREALTRAGHKLPVNWRIESKVDL